MKTEDEIVKIIDPVKLLKEIEAFFTFTNPPSEKDVKLIRASINYCIDNLPKSQPSGKEPTDEAIQLLRECRETLILDSLIDRSNSTNETLKKVDEYLKSKTK